MNNNFGTSGYGEQTIKVIPHKPTQYTSTFAGAYADVVATGSIYSNKGWTVTYKSGQPWTATAELLGDTAGDGVTPITGSASTTGSLGSGAPVATFNYRPITLTKDILHCDPLTIPWITQLSQDQISILEQAIPNPPIAPDTLHSKYPTFNSGVDSSYFTVGSAGDVLYLMARRGFRQIQIAQPVLTYNLNAPLGWDLTYYKAYMFKCYSTTTLASQLSIPANYQALMTMDTDPSSSDTDGIQYRYGWVKQPPSIDTQDSIIQIRQDYIYGLWPMNIFGVSGARL